MSDETLYRLVNPEFDFEFNGKTYRLRKANLDKAVQYQRKAKELAKEGGEGTDLLLAAFCIYIMLKDSEPGLTEDLVRQATPADIDVLECLATLGFISPSKVKLAKTLQDRLENPSTSGGSSSS